MMYLAEPTDFWGIVVPGWIGAFSGLVGGVVAVVSLLIAIRSNEKAGAARAAEAQTRSVVVDTIAELQRANADQLSQWLAAHEAQPGILATDRQVDDIRSRHVERGERYAALLERLRAGRAAAASPARGGSGAEREQK
jgi:hypothetical protein